MRYKIQDEERNVGYEYRCLGVSLYLGKLEELKGSI